MLMRALPLLEGETKRTQRGEHTSIAARWRPSRGSGGIRMGGCEFKPSPNLPAGTVNGDNAVESLLNRQPLS